MRRSLAAIVGLALCAAAGDVAVASDQIPQMKQMHPYVLTGGVVHTTEGVIEGASVVFENGHITAIGKNVTVPEGAESIALNGRHVYPGLIAAQSMIGLVEVGSVRATRDYAESGSINPNARAEVSINPDSETIPVTRANGVLTALVRPAGGLISGTSAVVSMDGWTWEDMTVKAPAGLEVSWPNMGVGESRWNRTPKKKQLEVRDENLRRINDMFADAKAYAKAQAAESDRGIPHHDTDLRLEAMLPFVRGEAPVFVHADGINEIEAAVDWAVAEGIRIVIVGGRDAARVTDLLVRNDIPVIVESTLRTPGRRWEGYDAPYALPAKLHAAGVRYCIAANGGSFNTPHMRNLPYNAAMAAAYGLPRDEALKAITIYAAEILGVADRLGSIESGKDATLIVTDGDPLEITTQVEMAFIQGRPVDLTSRHTQLYEKYAEKQRQLREAN